MLVQICDLNLAVISSKPYEDEVILTEGVKMDCKPYSLKQNIQQFW